MYLREFKCIKCKEKIKALRIKKRSIRIDKVDDDFCIHYKTENNPNYYKPIICSECGFVFTESFDEKKVDEKEFRKYFKNLPMNKHYCEKRTIEDAIKIWKATLLSAKVMNQDENVIGGICLMIAWLNRYVVDKEEEKRFLENAYIYLEKSYNNSINSIPDEKIIKLLFSLSLRIENITNAKKWLNLTYKSENKDYSFISEAKEKLDKFSLSN